MLTLLLLIIPLIGIFIVTADIAGHNKNLIKYIGLSTGVINLIVSLVIFIMFDFSNSQFQFVQERYDLSGYNLYFGLDGLSIYFVLLTTLIMPISILSNWVSINENVKLYIIIALLLETLLLAVFLVLDVLLFYISFESILPPLFLLIGVFGSSNRVRASFYLFLYTLLGSLFLLLSILTMNSIMGFTDYHAIFNSNFGYLVQLILFCGVFIAFAVKTPTIFLNTWLLKAHVESPLGGSIILAGIVLKLSLYGILRLILPILPKAAINYTFVVFVIGVITIWYASFSTLRTVDVKELIAYSSVSHAAVYLMGVLSNTIQGIGGSILLGLGHGFVSSGLFSCTGGTLYDRCSTRLITYYRGVTHIMPLFSIMFFLLCLSNAGTPLSLNFVGEFLSLYGTFERLPILGGLASASIVLSAAYTIYMFNRISFGGKLSMYFKVNIPDLNFREFSILFILVLFTVVLGIYPAVIIDGFSFSLGNIIYSYSDIFVHGESYNAYESSITSINSFPPHMMDKLSKLYMCITFGTLILTNILWNDITNLYTSNKNIVHNSAKLCIIFLVAIIICKIDNTIFQEYVEQRLQRIFETKNDLHYKSFNPDIEDNIADYLLADGNDSPKDLNPNSNTSENSCNVNPSNPDDDDPDKSNNIPETYSHNNHNLNPHGEGPSEGSSNQALVNQEGLQAEAERLQTIGNCEHRTFERGFVQPDPEFPYNCDICGNTISQFHIQCQGCYANICEDCEDHDSHVENFGDISDEDSALGEDGENDPTGSVNPSFYGNNNDNSNSD